ncbi:hypothetical protein LOTGIDRAFT_111574 [Lottia gigantea]|uniref:Gastrin/cholecystokinin type B receptor n=1 Tax=Lottia gigantea TaxID=225164 RepID=V4AWU2_LOTGI|nr:hypothetical protein LOTGIDRAFT_111574 [Lottia gigantea]ESP01968.1 hypothetical protein LOTGIDRAFT_111574 [Lottia gigantea]
MNCTDCVSNTFEDCENLSDILELLRFQADNETLIKRLNDCNYLEYPKPLHLAISIPYAAVFLLSVLGNFLVILTLVRHKKMRTITNVYLLNLAVSDLLLAVFCMPFTLIPLLLQDFIFGDVICVLIRYLQSVSVTVSCYTLVAISLERYYAICQPLQSRRWQTLYHSYRVLAFIWILGLSITIPIAVFTKRLQVSTGAYACREIWSDFLTEKLYTGFLDILLLLMPLCIMGYSYGQIGSQLWKDLTVNLSKNMFPATNIIATHILLYISLPFERWIKTEKSGVNGSQTPDDGTGCCDIMNPLLLNGTPQNLRQVNYQRVLLSKKRVIKMLCVVVLEYFICWTPLFIINTWTVMDYMSIRSSLNLLTKALVLLLAYISSCVHPITYCFMNRSFRQSFATAFKCCPGPLSRSGKSMALVSETSQVRHQKRIDATSTAQTSLRVVFQKKPRI